MSQPTAVQFIAIAIDELVSEPTTRRALRILTVRGMRHERTTQADDGARFFPLESLSDERAVLRLAALRDAVCPGAEPLNPWRKATLERWLAGSDQCRAWLKYAALQRQASRFAPDEWSDGEPGIDAEVETLRRWLDKLRVALGKSVEPVTVATEAEPQAHNDTAHPAPPPSLDEFRNVVREETNAAVAQAVSALTITPLPVNPDVVPVKTPDFNGWVPADTLEIEHGIKRNRLSEAVKRGTVRSRKAPRGWKDSGGKSVRRLYHRDDAITKCSPARRSDVPATETPPIPTVKRVSAPGR